ncbi:MAG TPA: sporulation peptidase YabG [Clostridiaceae bacterium]|nr:sporulation peptidase YabG [Clostridiaceae bacterium]
MDNNIKIGDIVTRKSYGGDIYFTVEEISLKRDGEKVCILRGVTYRIIADAKAVDLEKQDTRKVLEEVRREFIASARNAYRRSVPVYRPAFLWGRVRAARVLHIDGSKDFLYKSFDYYKGAGVAIVGKYASEKDQPLVVREYLEYYRPDILVLTGHDSFKKNADKQNINSYANSRYFIEAVREARKYQPDFDKLCIVAGACQSYYEAIMSAGANFASSPGRILIHALDPATVSQKVALTDERKLVTPQEVAALTSSGEKGIWGIDTRGHLRWR